MNILESKNLTNGKSNNEMTKGDVKLEIMLWIFFCKLSSMEKYANLIFLVLRNRNVGEDKNRIKLANLK